MYISPAKCSEQDAHLSKTSNKERNETLEAPDPSVGTRRYAKASPEGPWTFLIYLHFHFFATLFRLDETCKRNADKVRQSCEQV